MRIEQLEYFMTIVECSSINKASERLYISQQSLNNSMTRLENELNITLFHRHSHGVTLTDDGKEVLAYAKEVLEKTTRLKQSLSGNAKKERNLKGLLELSVCPAVSHWILPFILKKVRHFYDGIKISAIENGNLEMIKHLLSDEQRLYILSVEKENDSGFSLLNLDAMFYREICESKTGVIVSTSHPLAMQQSISLQTIRKYPLAVFRSSDNTQNDIEKYLESLPSKQIDFFTNNLAAYQEWIADSNAIGFMGRFPGIQQESLPSGLVSIPIKGLPNRHIVGLAPLSYYRKNQELIETVLNLF